ncbi:ferric reductase-like transmembrane domain-containing protein [Pseudooceanicola sp.]|uniref:ferredoxin reductase family protein n=1 Tax=Pseudooceanicola sp. TaxID=1914328 RepID=UPI002638AB04|nr:ferric reductase-like transmembrane domain-containing protein [Pseudooceanicola sp.]MDF1855844.1 ferric reductase-like transmembrane domain-containing protein [Pseudooceanicola sp.]
MKTIKITLWSLLAGLSLLWVAASLPLPESLSVIAVRNLLVQYSGVLSIGAMSVAMILAARGPWLQRWLNGLDKSYRLHKWLGIAALVTSTTHWVAANGPKWAVSWGLIEAPNRQRRTGELPDLGAVQTVLNNQRGTAEMLGEWAFYGAVLLIAVALIKRIPYRFFAKTHRLIALAYLALTFHAAVLMDFDAWTQPVGIVTALLMIAGGVVAVLALTRRIGRSRQVTGKITALLHFPSMKITESEITVDKGWSGHEAGQFAFVTFDRKEGAHPFTIASAWDPATCSIAFISKGLGDHTERLPETLAVGDDVTVEGPYGRFTFEDGKDRQIWIGAGIGITPFIARLKHLASTADGKQIDLIHCVPEIAPEPQALLEADATAAGARLHLIRDKEDGRLTGARLREMLPDWAAASIWFCGPAGFGESLRRDLVANGLRPADFHQELFNMR